MNAHEENTDHAERPLFSLGQTALLFLPGSETGSKGLRPDFGTDDVKDIMGKNVEHRVAQVTLEATEESKTKVETIASFFLVQHEVSELIMRIVRMHQTQPLSTPVRFVGAQYALIANSKPWTYGATLRLQWGDQRVHPCAEKWTFKFSFN